MAFEREVSKIPEAIEDISVTLFDPNPAGNETAGANYSVQVRFSDGSIVVRTGDLVPHITQAQINGLLSFMAAMRTKAAVEFLPD